MKRPEYVTCVMLGSFEGDPPVPVRRTWCTRVPDTGEFCFTDASHALLNARNQGRLLACPDCVTAMITCIRSHG